MGYASRNKQAASIYNKSIPLRLLKAFLGILLVFPMLPFVFAVQCYNSNEWPWNNV